MTESIAIPPGYAAPSQIKPADRRRIRGLDVLRGLAALAVLIFHYTTNYQRLFGHLNGKPLFSLPYGALGVQLFFIISGFVIFMTLEKTRRPRDFVRSRFARLYPAYWAAVLITFLVLHYFPLPTTDPYKYHPTLIRGLLNLTMFQEMLGVGHVDPVYWTLQLELCFYLLMFLLLAAKQLARVEFYLLGILIISELLQYLFPGGAPLLQHHHALGILIADLKLLTVCGPSTDPHSHIHVFLIGIMLFKLTQKFSPWHLMVLLICLTYSAFREPGTDFYLTAAFTAIVYAASRDWLRLLENRVTLFLGTISYSLYLTHQNIGYELIRVMEHHGVGPNLSILAAGVVAIAIAAAMSYGIEQPALRLFRGKKPTTQQRNEIPAGRSLPTVVDRVLS